MMFCLCCICHLICFVFDMFCLQIFCLSAGFFLFAAKVLFVYLYFGLNVCNTCTVLFAIKNFQLQFTFIHHHTSITHSFSTTTYKLLMYKCRNIKLFFIGTHTLQNKLDCEYVGIVTISHH